MDGDSQTSLIILRSSSFLGRSPRASNRDEVHDHDGEQQCAEHAHGDLRAGCRIEDESALGGGSDDPAEGSEDAEEGKDRHDVHRMLANFGLGILCQF